MQGQDNNALRRMITVFLLLPVGLAALVLFNAGPFAVNVFGHGMIVRSMLGPVLAVGAVWCVGMARPQWVWNKWAGLAALALICAHTAFYALTLPDTGPMKNAPLNEKGSFESFKDYNLIVVSLDTLRADHVGAYGYARNTTPALDRLAGESVLFENAVSSAPATLSSHATAFTGLYPGAHGAQVMTHAALPQSALTLAEILKRRGYATGGFTGGAQLSRNFGMGQGFDAYKDDTMAMAEIWPAARHWLTANRENKFFLFLHCYDIHTPYAPPAPFSRMFDPKYSGPLPDDITLDIAKKISGGDLAASDADMRHIRAQYDAGIRYTDTYIDQLYDYLKQNYLLKSTIVVVMADHGEELGERGAVGMHAHSLHTEVLHVPLIMRLPGARAAARQEARVGLVDLTPTLLDLLAVPYDMDQFQGRSFVSLLFGGKAPQSARVLLAEKEHGHTENTGRAVAVYAGPWKLITRTPAQFEAFVMKRAGALAHPVQGRALYNLEEDPQEHADQLAAHVQRTRALDALASRLTRWNRAAALSAQGAATGITPNERKKLKDLGYVK
jgi:arylsulfatase A-like enzyme